MKCNLLSFGRNQLVYYGKELEAEGGKGLRFKEKAARSRCAAGD